MMNLKIDLNSDTYQSNNAALSWPDGRMSYGDYFSQIFEVAATLKLKGIGEGSRVAIISGIEYRFPLVFFALLYLKSIVVPLNTRLPKTQMVKYLHHVKCKFLIPLDNFNVLSEPSDIVVISANDIFGVKKSNPKDVLPLNFSLEQAATILFTSGSSGKAKAVLHSVGNHYFSAVGSNTNISLVGEDRWLVTLPFYHVAAIAILFRTLLAGSTIVIGQNNQTVSEQLKRNNITHLSLVPTQLYRLLESPPDPEVIKKLKAVLIGGSSCPEILISQAIQMDLPLFLSYGSTEMSSQITTTKPNDMMMNTKSSGGPLPYRELKINGDGEVLARGQTLALGYLEGDQITPLAEEGGWYHTGDLGHLDEKKQLVISGRKDAMFISAGENIHPEEIENNLLHMENILEACVVPIKDHEFGTRPVAFLRMMKDVLVNENQIKDYLRDKISAIKIPIRFFEWPGDESLKMDRRKLQILAKERVGSEP